MALVIPSPLPRFLLVAIVIALQGCGRTPNSSNVQGAGNGRFDGVYSIDITNATLENSKIWQENGVSYAHNIHGISYEVHGGGPGLTKIEGETVTITNGPNHLEFKTGRLLANGRDCGAVQQGDNVVLDVEGQLFINQEKR